MKYVMNALTDSLYNVYLDSQGAMRITRLEI